MTASSNRRTVLSQLAKLRVLIGVVLRAVAGGVASAGTAALLAAVLGKGDPRADQPPERDPEGALRARLAAHGGAVLLDVDGAADDDVERHGQGDDDEEDATAREPAARARGALAAGRVLHREHGQVGREASAVGHGGRAGRVGALNVDLGADVGEDGVDAVGEDEPHARVVSDDIVDVRLRLPDRGRKVVLVLGRGDAHRGIVGLALIDRRRDPAEIIIKVAGVDAGCLDSIHLARKGAEVVHIS